jgi:hypothetical protein
VADVAELTVTPVTLAPIPLAIGSLLSELMAEENVLPFCSRATRCESGVLELKNFSQFAVICATAAELPEDDDEAGAEDAGADEAGAEDDAADEAADDEDDELELLQAETARASARPSTGARMIRRATGGNRMRVLSLGRMYY